MVSKSPIEKVGEIKCFGTGIRMKSTPGGVVMAFQPWNFHRRAIQPDKRDMLHKEHILSHIVALCFTNSVPWLSTAFAGMAITLVHLPVHGPDLTLAVKLLARAKVVGVRAFFFRTSVRLMYACPLAFRRQSKPSSTDRCGVAPTCGTPSARATEVAGWHFSSSSSTSLKIYNAPLQFGSTACPLRFACPILLVVPPCDCHSPDN